GERGGGGRGEGLSHRSPPMCWNRRVGVEGKPMDTGTARSRACRAFSFIAKARADAAHGLASALATGDALLPGGDHGRGEGRRVGGEGFMSRGHGVTAARLQVSQVT